MSNNHQNQSSLENQQDRMDQHQQHPTNSNKQYFQRHSIKSQRDDTVQNIKQDNTFKIPNSQSTNSLVQPIQNHSNTLSKAAIAAHPSNQRKKIFDDDTQSVTSYMTVKTLPSKQLVGIQQQQQMNTQISEPSNIKVQDIVQQKQTTQQGLEEELIKWQRMYSDSQQQIQSLQEAKKIDEQTHQLEIDDTKRHYEFKVGESIKKQQELVMKMQQLQQQCVNQSALLKERENNAGQYIKPQSVHVGEVKTMQSESEVVRELRDQKQQQDQIISDGKIYIEKIKIESQSKSELITQLERQKKEQEGHINQLGVQLQQSQGNCATMKSEIDKLLISNQEVARRLESERIEKDSRLSEYQKIIARTNQGFAFKYSEDEKMMQISQLETKLLASSEKNQLLSNDLSSRLRYIENLQAQFTNSQTQLKVAQQQLTTQNKQKVVVEPLPQIAEDVEEEMNYLMLSKKLGTDLYALDLGEMRQLARGAQEETERLRGQLNTCKQQLSEMIRENQILKQQQQYSGVNLNNANNNNIVVGLRKEKENLINENAIIVAQLKKEKQSREEETKILQMQITHNNNNTLKQYQQQQPQLYQQNPNSFTSPQRNPQIQQQQQPVQQHQQTAAFFTKPQDSSSPPLKMMSKVVSQPEISQQVIRISKPSQHMPATATPKQNGYEMSGIPIKEEVFQANSTLQNQQQLMQQNKQLNDLRSNSHFSSVKTLQQPHSNQVRSSSNNNQIQYIIQKPNDPLAIKQQSIPLSQKQSQISTIKPVSHAPTYGIPGQIAFQPNSSLNPYKTLDNEYQTLPQGQRLSLPPFPR